MPQHLLTVARSDWPPPAAPAKPRTYLVLLEELVPEMLDVVLQPLGWQRVTIEEAERRPRGVDLIVVDGKYNWDKRLYGVQSRLKGHVKAEVLTNKVDLHQLLMRELPGQIIAESVVVAANGPQAPRLPDASPWIWRPEGGWQGKGVEVVPDQAALDRAWREHVATTRGRKGALLSRYIMESAAYA